MSLIEIRQTEIVKKQYFFKLKSYAQFFSTMMILQVISFFLAIGGTDSYESGSNYFRVHITYYSATAIISLTCLWAFISAILITTKANRYDDFAFITNRVTSHLSNILFLLTASIIGGITSFLSGFLLKMIIYSFKNTEFLHGSSFTLTISEIFIGITATILYVLLFFALGYLVGTLVQLHKIFIVIIPGLLIGLNILSLRNSGYFTEMIAGFFYNESSFLIFFIKVILTAGLLFTISIAISNRLEVRK
ncbi:hypothetical protein ACQKP0_09705 [Heyndrickxia sp. NPDC080065]|uniref:hypothetical protein n=1 Tax=Heyndrickxia sp. NPDC080065 TaxID=3390568 RepID=UPI003D02F9F1